MTPDVPLFRSHTLYETTAVSLSHFDHPPGIALTDAEEQAAERFQINVVERGCFRLGYSRSEYTLGPGSVFLSRPGEMYTYSHLRHVEPDTCLSLAFSPAFENRVEATFTHMPLVPAITNRLNFLMLQLRATATDSLGLDALACELLDAAAHADDGRHLYRQQQLRWYAQRIGAARELMDADPATQHSLWNLSSRVAMSPFLFARVFRELIGVPPHQYLLRRRLRRARALLASGMSVTATCYEVGFNNLSHFTRSFRRHFGVLPSKLPGRRAISSERSGKS
jgi:AraC-like DNA-binding protein